MTDKLPRQICGSNYRLQPPGLENLKKEITQHTNNQITFIDIHELNDAKGRVILFEIPPAPRGIPTSWKGHFFGRIHENLSPLSIRELDQIRGQGARDDWSSQICDGATINDLDSQVLVFAKQEYKKKNPQLAPEVDQWDNITFLNKARPEKTDSRDILTNSK